MSFSFSGCLKQSKKGLCQANDVPHPYAFNACGVGRCGAD